MALREIKILGDPVLRVTADEVTEFDEELQTLARDMLDTMYRASGIGLAGPQIGVPKRVIVLDLGHSYFFNAPVTSLALERVPATLLLVFSAQILAIVVGTLLGVLAARKPNGPISLIVTFLSLFGFRHRCSGPEFC